MNVAIYQYHRRDTHSQDINQSGEMLILSAVTMCKDKVTELYGEDQNFVTYIDTETRMIESDCLKGAYVRPELENMLADIRDGRIDMVAVTYMGAVASDYMFILAFYIYLCQHNIKLITVREGEKIGGMLEKALEEYRKNSGM